MNNIQERAIYRTRLFSLLAEKFGWSIGGYTLAFEVSGTAGIIALALSMMSAATISSGCLYYLGLDVRPRQIRWALAWRGLSFAFMLLGGYYGRLWLVVAGGVASGIFVGVFWPTFYGIQRICGLDFTKWNARDKIAGAVIVLASGYIVDLLGPEEVLIISLGAILCSVVFSKNLGGSEVVHVSSGGTNKIVQFHAIFSPPSLIAMAEGAFNWMTNLTKLLVIMAGLVELSGLSPYLGLGMLLAVTQASGAVFTWGVKILVGRGRRVVTRLVAVGLVVSFASCSLLMSASTWFAGMVLLSIGSAIVFPILKDEVDDLLDQSGVGGRGLREYSRNIGRLVGSLITSAVWVANPELPMLALPIAGSVLIIASLWSFIHRKIPISVYKRILPNGSSPRGLVAQIIIGKGGEKIGLMKWIVIGTAAVVAGPIVLPLLAAGNCDGIDGGCGGCDDE